MSPRKNQLADAGGKVSESTPTEVRLVRARKVNGRWMGAKVKMDRDDIVKAIQRDRI
jgi:hypothetical protein